MRSKVRESSVSRVELGQGLLSSRGPLSCCVLAGVGGRKGRWSGRGERGRIGEGLGEWEGEREEGWLGEQGGLYLS